jgi:hypothetical protein
LIDDNCPTAKVKNGLLIIQGAIFVSKHGKQLSVSRRNPLTDKGLLIIGNDIESQSRHSENTFAASLQDLKLYFK